jgi:hypothetical protein
VCFSFPNQISASALQEEFLQFLTSREYFHELKWNIAHLGILLVNSNTTCLDVRRLFETDRIDADMEQRVSLIKIFLWNICDVPKPLMKNIVITNIHSLRLL